MTKPIDPVEDFIQLRVAKFEGIIAQHSNACNGEIGQTDISSYHESEIREIEQIARAEGKAEALQIAKDKCNEICGEYSDFSSAGCEHLPIIQALSKIE